MFQIIEYGPYMCISRCNILAVNSVWVYSSIRCSRGVHPFCILTAPDDYILLHSFSHSPRLLLPVSSLHPRGEGRIPSERKWNWPPPALQTLVFFSFASSCAPPFPAGGCPRAGVILKNSTTRTNISGTRAEKSTYSNTKITQVR